jgi:hypothetical protein
MRMKVTCDTHKRQLARVICKHILEEAQGGEGVGFLIDPTRNYIAWCRNCYEALEEEADVSLVKKGCVLICKQCFDDIRFRCEEVSDGLRQ